MIMRNMQNIFLSYKIGENRGTHERKNTPRLEAKDVDDRVVESIEISNNILRGGLNQ